MNSNWIAIALAAGIFLYGYILWMAMRRPIASGMRRLRNLPRSIQALLVVIAVIATVEAQKASTNNTGNAGNTNMWGFLWAAGTSQSWSHSAAAG